MHRDIICNGAKIRINVQVMLIINVFFWISGLYTRVWDVADYVVPPAENGAFFVATNVIITPNQTRGL